jgi:GxxExxY protein
MPTNLMPKEKLLYGELSYKINGILIEVHKELGQYAREKQVGDLLEKKFKKANIKYEREVRVGDSGNIVDFIVEGIVIIELKTVPFLIGECYDQIKRYLIQTNLKLGLLVNFRCLRVQIKRVLNPNNL